MNPMERFINAEEQLARAQVVTDERLTVLLVLTAVGAVLVLIGLGLQVLLLVYRQNGLAELRDLFSRLERRNDDVWALLQIVKEWAESARTHSKDAAATVKEVKMTTPASERHVIEEVRAVPEKTGEVVKKLMEDSDPFKQVNRQTGLPNAPEAK